MLCVSVNRNGDDIIKTNIRLDTAIINIDMSEIPSDRMDETLPKHAETTKLTDMMPELRMNLCITFTQLLTII